MIEANQYKGTKFSLYIVLLTRNVFIAFVAFIFPTSLIFNEKILIDGLWFRTVFTHGVLTKAGWIFSSVFQNYIWRVPLDLRKQTFFKVSFTELMRKSLTSLWLIWLLNCDSAASDPLSIIHEVCIQVHASRELSRLWAESPIPIVWGFQRLNQNSSSQDPEPDCGPESPQSLYYPRNCVLWPVLPLSKSHHTHLSWNTHLAKWNRTHVGCMLAKGEPYDQRAGKHQDCSLSVQGKEKKTK